MTAGAAFGGVRVLRSSPLSGGCAAMHSEFDRTDLEQT
jgi:hypothetical protein